LVRRCSWAPDSGQQFDDDSLANKGVSAIALSFPLCPKKALEDFATLHLPDAAGDIALVIQRWHLEQIDHAAGTSCF
jgi:hypothetical protein